ncbi:6-carboxyhexanoate--CoA ligase [Corynebacterium diphtheriae]|uniref:6-carboxyhexanoate--CoA ligase n=2 Tax=Corynebacterium diphtheriae TaxID=1717 RepID=UPI0005C4E40E|nr:6-carboxyhexanoate--CoA ligase [Corynebacterium diphtheriae]
MSYVSIKMHASRNGAHISGAETLVDESRANEFLASFYQRANTHSKGKPEITTLTIRRIKDADIITIPALEVKCLPALHPSEAHRHVIEQLSNVVSPTIAQMALHAVLNARNMRGAILLCAHTGQRLDPYDPQRGVRASTFGVTPQESAGPTHNKSHFNEALVLASKVMSAPGIVAEICISDDPAYTTGYVTTENTYIRIPHMKDPYSPIGGRVFLLDTRLSTPEDTISYLEQKPVLITGVNYVSIA